MSVFRFQCSVYLYKNPFKFYMKIHLADRAERGGGLFLRTENTDPIYSKSQTTATIIFHCVNVFKFESHTSAATWQLL
jgi:hypothetical protein